MTTESESRAGRILQRIKERCVDCTLHEYSEEGKPLISVTLKTSDGHTYVVKPANSLAALMAIADQLGISTD